MVYTLGQIIGKQKIKLQVNILALLLSQQEIGYQFIFNLKLGLLEGCVDNLR